MTRNRSKRSRQNMWGNVLSRPFSRCVLEHRVVPHHLLQQLGPHLAVQVHQVFGILPDVFAQIDLKAPFRAKPTVPIFAKEMERRQWVFSEVFLPCTKPGCLNEPREGESSLGKSSKACVAAPVPGNNMLHYRRRWMEFCGKHTVTPFCIRSQLLARTRLVQYPRFTISPCHAEVAHNAKNPFLAKDRACHGTEG